MKEFDLLEVRGLRRVLRGGEGTSSTAISYGCVGKLEYPAIGTPNRGEALDETNATSSRRPRTDLAVLYRDVGAHATAGPSLELQSVSNADMRAEVRVWLGRRSHHSDCGRARLATARGRVPESGRGPPAAPPTGRPRSREVTLGAARTGMVGNISSTSERRTEPRLERPLWTANCRHPSGRRATDHPERDRHQLDSASRARQISTPRR
jgi:hypothetical protein